jgi:drug/metabolite transporter (DMT)-like permease
LRQGNVALNDGRRTEDFMYIVSIAIAITGLIVYQLAMKTAPRDVHPWWLLSAAYAAAALLCVAMVPIWNRVTTPQPFAWNGTNLGGAVFIGVAAILIEIGYLLVYRNGWKLSDAPAVAQGVTLMAVFAIGVLFFREKLSWVNGAGIAMCVAGVILITRK